MQKMGSMREALGHSAVLAPYASLLARERERERNFGLCTHDTGRGPLMTASQVTSVTRQFYN